MRQCRLALGLVLVVAAAGCSWFGGDSSGKSSVFSVEAGQCFSAPTKVKAELSDLHRTSCTSPHAQEAYAIVGYSTPAGTTASSAYPGSDVLSKFAQGACAQRFGKYVGVDYLDSALFFTYLLPSARSWEQGKDRNVICFVTTAGAPLTTSIKGSKR